MWIHIVSVKIIQDMNFYTDNENVHQNAGNQKLCAVVVLTARYLRNYCGLILDGNLIMQGWKTDFKILGPWREVPLVTPHIPLELLWFSPPFCFPLFPTFV
jgi:hypothetical protein